MPADPLSSLLSSQSRRDRVTHVEVRPPRGAETSPWPGWAHPQVVGALGRRGIGQPWSHQTQAAELAWAGHHVILSTGTASGKSLAFQLPALTAALQTRGPRGERGASTLYLAPTKALAHDQYAALLGLDLDVRLATHDGDSSREERDWTREHAEYVLTNPDMLHHSLLPGHQRWAEFWRTLRFVVVDESHHYRGVFGAHVAQVLRRVSRVAALHGARPTFVLASATAASPGPSASRLIGEPVIEVTTDGSPRGAVTVALWEPPLTGALGENGAPTRRAAAAETADLLADLVADGLPTLAFVRSRRGTEFVALSAAASLEEVSPGLGNRVAAYRGGYLPEERRAIEQDLRAGRLTGLAATNALELGIDIAGLDVVLIAGFPGT
ncbi:MAG: DEAD/DEAH box helicase, partial [Nocardioides sp.]